MSEHIVTVSCGKECIHYIDFVVVVSDQEVPEDASLIEVTQSNHVLHPRDGSWVHGLDPPLWRQPLLLSIIINDLHLPTLMLGNDSGSQSNIKLSLGHWLYPNMLSLWKVLNLLE